MRACLVPILALVSACTRPHEVEVRLRVPESPTPGTVYELLVWPGSIACPSVDEVVSGGVPDGALRQAFTEGSARPVGRLETDRATVAALARDPDCAPRWFACAEVSLGAPVELALAPAGWSGAEACPTGLACEAGFCGGRPDAGPPPPFDAGPDAGDGGFDAGVDAGVDAGPPLSCPPDPALDGGAPGVAFTFREIAMGSVIETSYPDLGGVPRRTTGVELRDVDGDDDLDVTMSDRHGWWPHEETSRVYVNEGASWRDATAAVFGGIPFGTGETGVLAAQGYSALWAPFTESGRLDLVANAYYPLGSVFWNLADGEPRLGYMPGFPEAALRAEWTAAGDLDGDGWLDLVIGNSADRPRVFLNRMATRAGFVDATDPWLADDLASLYSATRPVLLDLDQDGDLDLFFQMTIEWVPGAPAEWSASPLTVRYFENQGDRFRDRSDVLAARLYLDGPIGFGDFDGDGDLDVIQAGKAHTVQPDGTPLVSDSSVAGEWRVLENQADGPGEPSFVDVTATAFPFGRANLFHNHLVGEGASVADLDGDGALDLVLVRGVVRMLPNRSDPTAGIRFGAAIDGLPGFTEPREVAVGDLEPDGDVDVAITDEDTAHGIRLLENLRGGGRVVRVVLDDAGPNRVGIGAHVRVYRVDGETRGALVAYRHVIASTDQHVDYAQHVALTEDGCYEVEVTWPRVTDVARVESRRVVPSGAPQTLRFSR